MNVIEENKHPYLICQLSQINYPWRITESPDAYDENDLHTYSACGSIYDFGTKSFKNIDMYISCINTSDSEGSHVAFPVYSVNHMEEDANKVYNLAGWVILKHNPFLEWLKVSEKDEDKPIVQMEEN